MDPLYQFYEMQHAALSPFRAAAHATRSVLENPLNPLSNTLWGKSVAAGCEVFERVTRRYTKPGWGLDTTEIDGETVPVETEVVWQRPFCNLVHFRRVGAERRRDPKVLIVAPMSGHHATLLRGTVEAFLPAHEVYITDWIDARMVPLALGRFDLDDYIDYVIEILHALGPNAHIIAVCQPSVPVLAAVSIMEARQDTCPPASMTLMGGPIDTRSNPTGVNNLATRKGLDWFRRNVITHVPFPNPGMMRAVYPGFLQLTGFMGMNLARHVGAHRDLFMHLMQGDGDGARKHREFYDEYLAVMDLSAEFYLQTVDTVFIRHALPKGEMTHRGVPVDPSKIHRVALLTVEGENDDISGVGQTEAAQRLCSGIPPESKTHHLQPHVGHYGVFNGSRFRAEIAPRIAAFMRRHPQGAERAHVNGPAKLRSRGNGAAAANGNGRAAASPSL